jgi:IS1 family transposase
MDYANKEYLKSYKNITVRVEVEMDEMGNFYHDKKHQVWLWIFWMKIFLERGELVNGLAIDHETDTVIAFWFGTREHKDVEKLLELIKPLNRGMCTPMATMRITSDFHQRL